MIWSLGIAGGFVAFMAAGIWLLKASGPWAWSLKRRAYMRYGAQGGILKHHEIVSKLEAVKKTSPIEKGIRKLKALRERQIDREILDAVIFLRNMASIEKGRNSSADSVIEKLAGNNGLLRPVFLRMLNLLRLNQTKEAAALFAQKTGTPAGRDFAGLLLQWDRMEPGELMETLLSYEKNMKAVRLTGYKRRDEIISDLIYLPVVVNILAIFINFIYVAYFIDQKEMLKMFF